MIYASDTLHSVCIFVQTPLHAQNTTQHIYHCFLQSFTSHSARSASTTIVRSRQRRARRDLRLGRSSILGVVQLCLQVGAGGLQDLGSVSLDGIVELAACAIQGDASARAALSICNSIHQAPFLANSHITVCQVQRSGNCFPRAAQ